jgi:hypothetical protein
MIDGWLSTHPLVLVLVIVAAILAALHEGRET